MRQKKLPDNKVVEEEEGNPSFSTTNATTSKTDSCVFQKKARQSIDNLLSTYKKSKKKAMSHKYEEEHTKPRYVATGKRPFVTYKIFDTHTQKYVRFKIECKNEQEAKVLLYSIVGDQIEGITIDSSTVQKEKKEAATKQHGISVKEAVQKFLSEKQYLKSFSDYQSRAKNFIVFCDIHSYSNTPIKNFTTEQVKEFFEYARAEGNGAKELNNKRANINAFFRYLLEEKIVDINPVIQTKKQKELSVQRSTFSNTHLKEMWEYFKEHHIELYHATKFMFYSFIRPGEMIQLLLSDIDFRTKKIKIRAEVGKTGLRYVKITPPLFDVLMEMGVQDRRGDSLLFCNKDETPIPTNRWSKVFFKYRADNKLPMSYVLYCFKHTGVKEHYLAGNNLLWIQSQCGHKDLASTIHYLSTGLGLDTYNDFPYIEPQL